MANYLTGFDKPMTETEIVDFLHDAHFLEELITESSYYRKHRAECSNPAQITGNELKSLYCRCRQYATNSIISGLYPLDQLRPTSLNTIDCDGPDFRILARVRTNYESPTIEGTANERIFLSFSILENRNLVHFPGKVIRGYYSHIHPSMVGYICPHDANTIPDAIDRLALTEIPETLLDLDDLITETRKHQTYCQLSIKSKYSTYCGPIIEQHTLLSDCIICIGSVDPLSEQVATTEKLPLLLIRPAKTTLLRSHDFFPTPELAFPKYA